MSSDRPLFPAVPPVLARRLSFPAPTGRPARDLGRVTVVSAPPGSGKTVLLRSWIGQTGAVGCAAWVPASPAPMRISSKNGCETGDDDLRGRLVKERDDRKNDRVLSGFGS